MGPFRSCLWISPRPWSLCYFRVLSCETEIKHTQKSWQSNILVSRPIQREGQGLETHSRLVKSECRHTSIPCLRQWKARVDEGRPGQSPQLLKQNDLTFTDQLEFVSHAFSPFLDHWCRSRGPLAPAPHGAGTPIRRWSCCTSDGQEPLPFKASWPHFYISTLHSSSFHSPASFQPCSFPRRLCTSSSSWPFNYVTTTIMSPQWVFFFTGHIAPDIDHDFPTTYPSSSLFDPLTERCYGAQCSLGCACKLKVSPSRLYTFVSRAHGCTNVFVSPSYIEPPVN